MKGTNTQNQRRNTIVNKPLPKGFINRVIECKSLLAEVDTTSLEETIFNFQRDGYPERELKIWEHIAQSYVLTFFAYPDWSLSAKKGFFQDVLEETLVGVISGGVKNSKV